jgi:LuxR family transcriptional regulator, maltose regulon positive regulatory protein
MFSSIIATKLYRPPPRPNVVLRPRLIERLNEGLQRKLTLISAPAGFGKTTLASEWLASCGHPAAWLSLDEGDNDPARFLMYLTAALQKISAHIGEGVQLALQSPQPPNAELVLTSLINDTASVGEDFVLVLDDYHAIDSQAVDQAVTFLLEHLPRQMHLIIATREDPQLPLARLRAGSQLSELRASDLRFTPAEAADFLNRVMQLNLSADDIATLETRTEGWIAGLQLAALALQGTAYTPGGAGTAGFIQSFTGSHRFVMDYLVEEVLHQQPEGIQTFLLYTSILDRLCGSLCDAIRCERAANEPPASGQETLEHLERLNLFIVALDGQRLWYRYHHLFADLLRQRLRQTLAEKDQDAESLVRDLHLRASQWYEEEGHGLEAFQHAAAAGDIDRAERLIEDGAIPLHLRSPVTAVLDWLESLPRVELEARPQLWWRYGSLMLVTGQTTGVEEKLQAAEAALQAHKQGAETDEGVRNLVGQVAAARSVLALTRYQTGEMLAQGRRALEHLAPESASSRSTALWTMGYAHLLEGDRSAARRSLTEAIAVSQASGALFTYVLATIGLGNVQEAENELYLAAETYRGVLQLTGDQPLQIVHEVHLGLARIHYQWNELQVAEQHARQSLLLAQQYDRVIDRFILCELFLARLYMAQGDMQKAAAILAETSQSAHQPLYSHRLPEVIAEQAILLLRQGDLAGAERLAQAHNLSVIQARIHINRGESPAALRLLEPQLRQAQGLSDERLKLMVLIALAHQGSGEVRIDLDRAVDVLGEVLALAELGGFIRLFLDEGGPMRRLLTEAADRGVRPGYTGKLLAAFEAEQQKLQAISHSPAGRPLQSGLPLLEPLSPRELEVLQLIDQGLSNREISERLYLALDTVKGHNRKLFDKLQVQRRTEAVARARQLGLL